jgi:thiamine biosynthesis protein ThiI
MLILVHYGELALKRKKRRLFENKLVENIKKASSGKVRRLEGRLIVEGGEPEPLKNVFGISWFAPAYRIEKDLEAIKELVIEKIEEKAKKNPTFGVFVKRADKSFPYTSYQIAERVGEEVVKRYGLKVRLNTPELPIYIEIAKDAFVYFEKTPGLGGLPVGGSGNVLCLLSGGIDSPVAAYLAMKRGCHVDFIHFHVFPENETAFQGKIEELVLTLNKYQFESRIFLVPYWPFEVAFLEKGVGKRYELVLFRRFMLRVAERIAQQYGHKAIVTGDSLGQVASQTLENIKATLEATSMLVLQPLISFDKQEITDMAKRIGSYEISIKPYKDCCSIVSSHSKTEVKLGAVKRIEERLDMEGVISKTLELIGSQTISGLL